ncbi:MAG: hypothetical protein HY334_02680 [Armatimonadetes bacterium]|nr:hypothetical protein [Armatimonadota bacterium]
MTSTEFGWLAGILDGEGTVAAWLTKKPSSSALQFQCHIVFYNTDPRIIRKVKVLAEEIVGHVLAIHDGYGSTNRRIYGVPIFRDVDVQSVLRELSPELVAKREQAVLLSDHLAWRAQYRTNGRYPDEVYKRDQQVVSQLRTLNHRFRARKDSVGNAMVS